MKIDAYANFNEGCVSVRSREIEDYGTVVAHKDKIHVKDVEFVVQPAGLKRARESRIKNVHALVRGEWDENEKVLDGTKVIYDLWGVGAFIEAETGREVASAERVAVTSEAVYAEGLSYADT